MLSGTQSQNKYRMFAETVLVMLLWGALFPAVKFGYKAFAIDTAFYPNLLLFAGLRFLVGGSALTGVAFMRHERIHLRGKALWGVLGVGLFAVALHYACTYVGLSLTDSSKTALLKQSGVLFFVCFSFLFFKEEKFSVFKLGSAVFGLAGILVLSAGSVGLSFGPGEILIVSASVCTVAANVICKKYTVGIPSMTVTAYSQLFGGLLLTVTALATGGTVGALTPESIGVFVGICAASCVSYVLWNKNVQSGTLSQLFIIKFLEPLFAAVFGALLLGENIFKATYLFAFIFIFVAILLSGVRSKK